MEKRSIEINSDLYQEAEEILDNLDVDVEIVVRMALKRIIREKSINFILQEGGAQVMGRKNFATNPFSYPDVIEDSIFPSSSFTDTQERMTKSIAIRIFRAKGHSMGANVTFASKNRTAYNYWANPSFDCLQDDWTLILNDWPRKQLYLFQIPRNAISEFDLVARSDVGKETLVDLQICYNDPTFTDSRSDVSFKKYLVDQTSY